MPVKCSGCGKVSPERTAFCASCGTAIWPPPEGSLISEEEAAGVPSAATVVVGTSGAADGESVAEVEAAWEVMVQAREAAGGSRPGVHRNLYLAMALLVGIGVAIGANVLVGRRERQPPSAGSGVSATEMPAAAEARLKSGLLPSPQPHIRSVVFARAIDAEGSPLRETEAIRADDPSPICVLEVQAPRDKRRVLRLGIDWTVEGQPVSVWPQSVSQSDPSQRRIVFPIGLPADAKPGEYIMVVRVNGELVGSAKLRLLAPGS